MYLCLARLIASSFHSDDSTPTTLPKYLHSAEFLSLEGMFTRHREEDFYVTSHDEVVRTPKNSFQANFNDRKKTSSLQSQGEREFNKIDITFSAIFILFTLTLRVVGLLFFLCFC